MKAVRFGRPPNHPPFIAGEALRWFALQSRFSGCGSATWMENPSGLPPRRERNPLVLCLEIRSSYYPARERRTTRLISCAISSDRVPIGGICGNRSGQVADSHGSRRERLRGSERERGATLWSLLHNYSCATFGKVAKRGAQLALSFEEDVCRRQAPSPKGSWQPSTT